MVKKIPTAGVNSEGAAMVEAALEAVYSLLNIKDPSWGTLELTASVPYMSYTEESTWTIRIDVVRYTPTTRSRNEVSIYWLKANYKGSLPFLAKWPASERHTREQIFDRIQGIPMVPLGP